MASRIRYNNSCGSLGASLSNSATSITFSVAPSWATLTGSDYIPLILDPPTNVPNASFEIVYVTAYTAGATTATIVRGRENTSPVSHLSTAEWMCSPTAADAQDVTAVAGTSGSASTLPATISFTHPNSVVGGDICCVFVTAVTPALTFGGTSIGNFGKVTLPNNTGFYGNSTVMLYEQVQDTTETVTLTASGTSPRLAWVVMYFHMPRNYGSTTTVSTSHSSTPTIPNGTAPSFLIGAMYGTGGSSTTAIPSFSSSYEVQVSAIATGTNPCAIRVGFARNPVASGTISVPDIDSASILINWI